MRPTALRHRYADHAFDPGNSSQSAVEACPSVEEQQSDCRALLQRRPRCPAELLASARQRCGVRPAPVARPDDRFERALVRVDETEERCLAAGQSLDDFEPVLKE
jgi:hypothetical protein